MNLYQCDGLVTRLVHVKVEAENKQAAANKAFALFEEHGTFVLWDDKKGLWLGPEDHSVDRDIDVCKALDGPVTYWDEADTIRAERITE